MARNCKFVYGSDLIQQILILFTRSSGKPPRIIIIWSGMGGGGGWIGGWMDGWILLLKFYRCCFIFVVFILFCGALMLSSFIQLTLAVESVKH